MTEENLIGNVWSQREHGLELHELNALGAIGKNDVKYICDHVFPFVQILNGEVNVGNISAVKFVTTNYAWDVHDYGEALSVAAPHGPEYAESSLDEGGGEDGEGSGIIGQQIDAAEKMAALISEKGWSSAELIAGTEMMKRFLWIAAKRYGFKLNGYNASEVDEKRYELLLERARKMDVDWEIPKDGSVRVREMSAE